MGRLAGQVGLLSDIVQDFLANSPRMLSAVIEAVESGDAEGLARAAHSLKGTVDNFAAKPAFDTALNLEMMGQHKTLSRATEAYGVLSEKVLALEHALKAFVKEKVPCESS